MNTPIVNAMATVTPVLVDPRHALLARASAWCELVDRDEMDIDDAYEELLQSVRDIEQFRNPQRPTPKPKQRVPLMTIEAVKHCVRERGEAALNEPDNLRRLRLFDPQSLAEFDAWLEEKGYARCRT